LGATVVGLDIDAHELGQAPDGVYDETVCSDLAQYSGDGTADLVVCQALLEHVRDVPGAFRAIASILRPDGVALVFVPSRNALYARLNLMLPERLKRALLHGIFPHTKRDQGFPAYYDNCTPRDFRRLAAEHGLFVREMRCYYRSSYFSFFFPAYVVWRAWLLLFHTLAGEQAAETFTVVLQKT
jgi:2-polyprenyl-6-hydroxyphenyl methylase/3-demethylubiquinone-9 3-methyltransferase